MSPRQPIVAALTALAAAMLLFVAQPAPATQAATPAAKPAPPAKPARPVVRLATLDWEPYIGTRMPDQGYAAALVRAAFADQGWTVRIEFYPWARALHLAGTGAVDGLMPEYYNPSRLAEFKYSAAFPGGPLVFYKRRGDPISFAADPSRQPDSAFRALRGKRFGVVRGYLNTQEFDAASYLTKEEANDDATNLRKLVYKRIDLAVIDRRVAEHIIRTEYPGYRTRVEPMAPALAEVPLYIAFSRKSPRNAAALLAFNRGLAAMKRDGRVDALYQRYIIRPSAR